MAITFAVDDVTAATDRPSTRRLLDQFRDVLAFGGDGDTLVLAETGVHPLLAAVHTAFAEHRPLIISPDAVWLTIAHGVAHHVRLHSDELGPRLVRHPGRRRLDIVQDGPFPTDAPSLQRIIHAFRLAVAEQIGEGRARLLTCDFSTTTEVERVASEVVLLDAVSPYFDYVLTCVCGIPNLTLTGTPEDWKAIRARIDVIAELDLQWWTASLGHIADRLVEASQGRPDIEFFRSIYKPKRAYGWERVTGWIARLFPYLGGGGRYNERNPLLSLPMDWQAPDLKDGEWYDGPGIVTSDVPARASSCLIQVRDKTALGARFDLNIDGGLMSVSVDVDGRLEPRAGWSVRKAETSIGSVIEELKAREDVALAPRVDERDRREAGISLPAELVALYDAMSEARFFGWRLRPIAEFETLRLSLHGDLGSTSVTRFLDLPDGTCLAFDWGEGGLLYVARLRVELLSPPKRQTGEIGDLVFDEITGLSRKVTDLSQVEIFPPDVESTEDAREVPVVARSIAAVLSHALRSSGATDLPKLAAVFDVLPAWQRTPRPPRPPRRPPQR